MSKQMAIFSPPFSTARPSFSQHLFDQSVYNIMAAERTELDGLRAGMQY